MRAGTLIGKLIPSMINTFKAIFTLHSEGQLILPIEYQREAYKLLKEIMILISFTEGVHCDPTKVFVEEKLIFELIEYLSVVYNDLSMQKEYFDFLLELVEFKVSVIHSDGFVRRVMEILKNCLLIQGIGKELLKEVVSKLYYKLESVMDLRFDNEACKILLSNASNSQSLWHIVIRYFIVISTYLVNPKLCEDRNTNSERAIADEKFISSNKEFQDMIWNHIVHFINKVKAPSKDSLNKLNKSLTESIIIINQELNSILLAFIGNILLPSSIELSRELQESLINLINTGYSSSGSFLSKFCMDTLLSLCIKIKEPSEMKCKMAGLAAVALINKCKELLRKFIEDEHNKVMLPE